MKMFKVESLDDIIVNRCPLCGKGSVLIVENDSERERLNNWRQGKGHIQNIFPELPVGIREVLISGAHEDCFDEAFSNEY